jgi:fibronectin type 3 domain-containing protein
VYRATSATGSYSRINSVLDASMSYTDATVQSGQTYYYTTTAVDSSGVESIYSNKVQVAVPFP